MMCIECICGGVGKTAWPTTDARDRGGIVEKGSVVAVVGIGTQTCAIMSSYTQIPVGYR